MKAIYFGDRHVKEYYGTAVVIPNSDGLYLFTSFAGESFACSFMELSFI